MKTLQTSVREAYLWTFGGNLARQLLSFGLSMLLARFLSPSDYGTVGMVAIFTTILTALQDLGIGRAVIYFENADSAFSTYCTVSTAAGAVLSLGMFLSAPLIARFYAMPGLIPIVRWLSLTLFFGGLRSASQSMLTKRLLFQRLTFIEAGSGIFAALVAVVLAWRGFGVWSLVFNLILGSVLNTFLVLHAFRPSFTVRLDLAAVKRALAWGTPLVGSTLLWSAYDNTDNLVVGKLMNNAQLGYYSLAFRLATLVNERIGAIISRVSFPTFAALQNDKPEVARHWMSVTQKAALISFPLLALLAVFASDLISVVLGAKWLPAVLPLRLLCVVGAIRVLTPIIVNLLPALGRPGLAFQYTLANAIIMPVAFYIGCKTGGIVGVGWSWVIVFPFIAAYLTARAIALVEISWGAYLKNLTVPVLSSAAATSAAAPLLYALRPGLLRLLLMSFAGVSAASLCTLAFESGRQLLPASIVTFLSDRLARCMPLPMRSRS